MKHIFWTSVENQCIINSYSLRYILELMMAEPIVSFGVLINGTSKKILYHKSNQNRYLFKIYYDNKSIATFVQNIRYESKEEFICKINHGEPTSVESAISSIGISQTSLKFKNNLIIRLHDLKEQYIINDYSWVKEGF